MAGIAIVGYGRMGKQVEYVLNDRNIPISAIIDPNYDDMEWRNDSLDETDTAICFTTKDDGFETSKRILEKGVNAVVGTTKFYENSDGSTNSEIIGELDRIARDNDVSFLYAHNFDPSMNLLSKKLDMSAMSYAALGYKPIIIEVHHTGKKSDVSGTAKGLIGKPIVSAYKNKSGLWFDINQAIWPDNFAEEYDSSLLKAPFDPSVEGNSADMIRKQIKTAEENNYIPIVSIRYGDIPGTHMVLFMGDNSIASEYHEVTDRQIFAKGAVDAALGIYDLSTGAHYLKDIV